MELITLPNRPTQLPPSSTCIELRSENGTPVRVILELGDRFGDNLTIYAQAYQMTEEGNFATAPNGYPSRTGRTGHTNPLTAVGDTLTITPGWVRYVPPPHGPGETPATLGAEVVATKPATAEPGTIVSHNDEFYIWSLGLVYDIACVKARELDNILGSSLALSGIAFGNFNLNG